MNDLATRLAGALDVQVARISGLTGGCVGEVYLIETAAAGRVVAKVDAGGPGTLHVEGAMLGYLAEHSTLPVPRVLHVESDLLVMEWLSGGTQYSGDAEEHAAELLADLHGVTATHCGFERDTLIGALHQPNPRTESWVEFFGEQRLRYMAREAHRVGRIDAATVARVDRVAGRLGEWLVEPAAPSLLHGDVWSGNVLADGDRITGFIDPALYYGDPEVELAFISLFHTFGDRFFASYGARRSIAPGFFEERRDLYNLYPLLVHARLFGGGYPADVQRILSRFGC